MTLSTLKLNTNLFHLVCRVEIHSIQELDDQINDQKFLDNRGEAGNTSYELISNSVDKLICVVF